MTSQQFLGLVLITVGGLVLLLILGPVQRDGQDLAVPPRAVLHSIQ